MKTLVRMSITVVTVLIGLAYFHAALACSDVLLRGKKDKESWIISARNLDYHNDLNARVVSYPKNQQWKTVGPDGNKGMEWKNAYGIVAVEARLLGKDKLMDGMNDAGLSVAAMWMKSAVFKSVPSETSPSNVMAASDLVAWLLGRFPNVETVKGALELVDVWYDDKVLPYPIHLAIHDAEGKSLVVEWVAGQISIKDDKVYVGVLTNEPDYDQQLKNLQAYEMQERGKESATSDSIKIMGDPSSTSRFVRLYRLKKEAWQVVEQKLLFWNPLYGAGWNVQQAMHLMNRVTGVHGTMTHQENGEDVYPHTAWTVVRDHLNKSYYFRGYQDLAYSRVDLKSVRFAGKNRSVLAGMDRESPASALENADVIPSAGRVERHNGHFDLSVNIPVAVKDHGKDGTMYVFARKKDGSILVWRKGGWSSIKATENLKASWSGPLASQSFDVLKNAAMTRWKGTDFYAGYSVGSSDAAMFLDGHCASVYSLP